MDVGNSLNPGIDIGQIEGAFIQGYGLYTLEEQRYTPSGYLLTQGPGFYKIPGLADIPIEFNVSLLKGVSNPKAVYSSKVCLNPCNSILHGKAKSFFLLISFLLLFVNKAFM